MIEQYLQSSEVSFVAPKNMPEEHVVGGTQEECQIYKESDKNGYLVKSMKSLFGFDGEKVYTAVIFSRYPHQLEYHPVPGLMIDIINYSKFVHHYYIQIEQAIQTMYPKFKMLEYFDSIDFISIGKVHLH